MVVGDRAGWRTAFAANAVFGLIVVVAQIGFLPRVSATTAIDVGRLFAFAKVRVARIGFLASGLAIGGHFIAYTFLEPYLRDTLDIGQTGVALVLAGYAMAGIAGAFLGERFAVRDIRRAFSAGAILVGISAMLAIATAGNPAIATATVMIWGLAFGAVPVCLQIWMFNASPKLFEAGSALMVSAVQIALSAGAAVGGVLVDSAGIGSAESCAWPAASSRWRSAVSLPPSRSQKWIARRVRCEDRDVTPRASRSVCLISQTLRGWLRADGQRLPDPTRGLRALLC